MLVVSMPRLDDDEFALLRRVHRELDLDPALDLSDVDVAVEGHDVILTGSVPGTATHRRIERAVARIDGVDIVDNQLIVPYARSVAAIAR